MEPRLTGNGGIDLITLEEMDDHILEHLYQSNEYVNRLCDENFWKTRTINTFGPEIARQKHEDIDFHNYYLLIGNYSPKTVDTLFSNEDYYQLGTAFEYLPHLRSKMVDIVIDEYLLGNPDFLNWSIGQLNWLDELGSCPELDRLLNRIVDNMDLNPFLAIYPQSNNQHILYRFISKAIEQNNNDITNELYLNGLISGADFTNVIILDGYPEEVLDEYLDNLHYPNETGELMAIQNGNLPALKQFKKCRTCPTENGDKLAKKIGSHRIKRWYRKNNKLIGVYDQV